MRNEITESAKNRENEKFIVAERTASAPGTRKVLIARAVAPHTVENEIRRG